MKTNYSDMDTDSLLELLPSNLHLARNENAPEYDRWRIYNVATEKYVAPGFETARELVINTLTKIDEQVARWVGKSS